MTNILFNVAEAASKCVLNGVEVPCDQVIDQVGRGVVGLGIGFAIVALIIGLAFTVFWVMMIIHAATKPIQNKAVWIIAMIIFGVLGAIVYYFAIKRPMDKNGMAVGTPAPFPAPASSVAPPTSAAPQTPSTPGQGFGN